MAKYIYVEVVSGVPLATEPGVGLVILPLIRILQRNLKQTTDTFLFISLTTNVFLFKFLCNVFIGVRIIIEMPGSVPNGTHCIICIILNSCLHEYMVCAPPALRNTSGWHYNKQRGAGRLLTFESI